MAKNIVSYAKIMKLAKDYCVDTNTFFIAAAKTYTQQTQLIADMRAQLAEDGMTVTKEYVKGRENLCINPLVQELPKHTDAANRTLQTMMTIISTLGVKAEPADELEDFAKRHG